MSLTITKAQRDALYDQILGGLSGIGDVWLAVGARNYDAAQRLGRDYSDDLRLVTDDLGWGEGQPGTIELTTPPDVLRRVLGRLHDSATSHTASQGHGGAEARETGEHDRMVAEVCRSVLADLDAPEGGSRWKISRVPSLLPRFPRAFRKDHSESAGGTRMWQELSAKASVIRVHHGRDEWQPASLYFGAILITDPVEGKDLEGNAVTQLLVAIADPDSGESHGGSMHRVEVPGDVAERYGEKLSAGDLIFITGQLSGDGGIVATEIHPETPGEEPGQ